MKKCDALIIGYAVNSTSGGFTNKNVKYVDTVGIKYLYSHFYGTYCAEPVAFLQLAAEMRKQGLNTEILDGLLLGYNRSEMEDLLLDYCTNIYCFSLYESSKEDVIYLMKFVKKHNPNAVVITGGPYVTLCYKELLESEAVIDYVAIGDGDRCMTNLVQSILKGEREVAIPNIAIRGNDGKAILTAPPECVDMDDLQPLERDFVSIIQEKGFSLSVASSRGCGYASCSFCYLPQYQKNAGQPKYRYRAPKLIVEEMKQLIEKYHIDKLTFVDDDFLGPNKEGIERAVELFQLIVSEGIHLNLYMNVRVASVQELIRRGLLDLAAQAGMRYLFIGFESYNDDVLRRYKKGITTSDIDYIVDELERRNIYINPGMITFDRYLTPKHVLNNVKLLERIHYYDLFMFTRTLMDLPSETQAMKDNRVKRGDFEDENTERLYRVMVKLRDYLYPKYGMVKKEKINDEVRNAIVKEHFSCFYKVYDALLKSEGDSLVDGLIQSSVSTICELIHYVE